LSEKLVVIPKALALLLLAIMCCAVTSATMKNV